MIKKCILVIAVLFTIALTGCACRNSDRILQYQNASDTKGKEFSIPFKDKNAFELNYTDIYNKILPIVDAKENVITANIDETFDPKGSIISFRYSLMALDKTSNNKNYNYDDYSLDSGDDDLYLILGHGLTDDTKYKIDNLELSFRNSHGIEAWVGAYKTEPAFKKSANALDQIDLRSVISEYSKGTPRYYRLLSKQKRDIIYDEKANTIFLYLTSEGLKKAEKPSDAYGIDPMIIPNHNYYVIMPYYEKSLSITGVDEYTAGQAANGQTTYIASNIIVIIIDV